MKYLYKEFKNFEDGIDSLTDVSHSAYHSFTEFKRELPKNEAEAVMSLAENVAHGRVTGNDVGWITNLIANPNIVIYTTGSGIVFGWKPHKISSDGIPGLCWDDDGYDFFIGIQKFREGSTLLKSGLENGWEVKKNDDFIKNIGIRYY